MRDWLVAIRKSLGWNQYKTAGEIGISQSYYASIETGKRGVPPKTAKVIADKMLFVNHGIDWTRFYAD